MSIARMMRVLQFGDSVLPIGSFSFSNALESAVQEGVVRDAATLGEFVTTSARRAATSDGIALLHAHRAARERDIGRHRRGRPGRLRAEARRGDPDDDGPDGHANSPRWAPPPCRRRCSAGGWTRSGTGITPGTYPVGLGVLFAELGSPEEDAFAVHQYGVAMTTLSAALRLMRIDHRQVQAILYAVRRRRSPGDYAAVREASLADMASFAPMADILAAIHVRSHVRMFMN